MKYKKYSYIILLMLVIIIGINKTYAMKIKENNNVGLAYSEYYSQTLTTNIKQINNTTGNSVKCEALFGKKEDPESISYLINEILKYPKIIVPILVIVLGTVDLAKAVLAGKEDTMKKAQSTFIKRLLIGVVIFFVPMILDIFMYLADMVWEGFEMCGL